VIDRSVIDRSVIDRSVIDWLRGRRDHGVVPARG
jgi:hypothetical protein